jgi:hypothetical protein
MLERGKQENREYAIQPRDYSGLRWSNITPTDIDGFIDFGDKIFIFFELKHGDSDLSEGQGTALQRLVDATGKTKDSLLIIAKHNCEYGEEIDAASCIVVKYRTNNIWRTPRKIITLKQIIDLFLKSKETIPTLSARR